MNPLTQILNRHRPKPIGINEVEWSVRAKNALSLAGITSLKALVTANGKELQAGKNTGVNTMREFIRGCVSQGLVPEWIRDVQLVHHPVAFCPRDMVVLSGPYAAHERWMLELAIAQLGGIGWVVVQDADGMTLCRDREGFVEVEAEE